MAQKMTARSPYIYSHPNSYEPLAQLGFARDNENPTACTTYYYHNDQIGIPRELTDEEGKVCWYGSYAGWGKLKESYQANDTVHQPFRLQNQYYDSETGLHYNFFRYYEPNVGRFTQLDPIGLAGGENLYGFAPNVSGWIDPLGLHTEIIIWEPVGYGSSSFGHISSNVNGVNYSWGPNGWDSEKSAVSYAETQAKFRSGVGIPLNLTKEQEEKLISCYSKKRKKYQFLINNCGDPHEECLTEALGERLSTSIRPVSIGFDYLNSKHSKKEKVIYQGPERKIWESNPISQF